MSYLEAKSELFGSRPKVDLSALLMEAAVMVAIAGLFALIV